MWMLVVMNQLKDKHVQEGKGGGCVRVGSEGELEGK